MTDHDALLRAILEFPHDDTPRLVYADHLDESGEPGRARLVRTQVDRTAKRRARWPLPRLRVRRWFLPWWSGRSCWRCVDPEWNLMVGRVRDVGVDGPGELLVVRRGFVDEVRLPLAAFLEHAESLFRQHPVTRVVLTDREPVRSGSKYWASIGSFLPGDWKPVVNVYGTKAIAAEWQSAACVAHGRELAGLPALGVNRVGV